jgi:hypothetical protein
MSLTQHALVAPLNTRPTVGGCLRIGELVVFEAADHLGMICAWRINLATVFTQQQALSASSAWSRVRHAWPLAVDCADLRSASVGAAGHSRRLRAA